MATLLHPVIPPDGIVSLADKQLPVCETDPPYQQHYAFTRAKIDVKEWKEKLLSLPPERWSEDVHQRDNVALTRPAHDAWGIGKIVFNFCDDFLLKVLDFPYSQSDEWRPLLQSVYSAIGISEECVVRSLLASMPPGVNIPVHHDTGLWVKHTHRLHMAIITGDEVDFRVGPNAESMQRYLFDEGRIVELNNQAKHAVLNGMTTTHRVHLIFDYVDDFRIEKRFLLQPGERIFQTRRSIDLQREADALLAQQSTETTTAASSAEATATEAPEPAILELDIALRQVPSFIIIGAQKSGTTSMYEYICQHPLVAKGKRRETHYFDWRFNDSLGELHSCSSKQKNSSSSSYSCGDSGNSGRCDYQESAEFTLRVAAHRDFYMNFFFKAELDKHLSLITGESTPSYLLHSDIVIPRMLAVCPWAKLLVMLRDPTQRAFSQYQMAIDPTGTPQQLLVRGEGSYSKRSFGEIIREEISELNELGVTPEDESGVFLERYLPSVRDIKHGGHSLVARGLYVLQLRLWMKQWPQEQMLVMPISRISKSAATPQQVQQTMNDVFAYLALPPHDVADCSAKNTRSYQSIAADDKQLLDDFYEPYNAALFKLMGVSELQW